MGSTAAGRRSRWPWAIAALGAGILVALAVGVAQRRPLAERLLVARLATLGLRPAELRVTRLDARGITLRDVRVGRDDPATVEHLEADWSPASLLALRLDAVRLDRVRLPARVGPGGLSLGPLDPLLEGPPSDAAGPLLPAPRVVVDDLRVALATPAGPAELGARGRADEAADGVLSGSLALELSHPRLDARGELTWSGPPDDLGASLTLTPRPDPAFGVTLRDPLAAELRLDVSGPAPSGRAELAPLRFAFAGPDGAQLEGRTPRVVVRMDPDPQSRVPAVALEATDGVVRAPAWNAEASGITLSLRHGSEGLEARAALGALRDLARPVRFAPLSAELHAAGPVDALALDGRIADRSGSLTLVLAGEASLPAASGRAQLRLAPLRLAPGGAQPSDWLPALSELVSEVSGEIEAHGTAELDGAGPSARATVALRDLSLQTSLARVEGVNGTVTLEGPPLATPGEQLLAVARVDVGLPLVDGLVAFTLHPDGPLEVREAVWRWAGGRLRTATRIDADATDFTATLEAEQLDLAEILEWVELDGLSGTGTISGRIPLVRTADAIRVEGARLSAGPDGGTLRYAPAPGVDALGQSQPARFGLALDALSDFRYETLRLTLDGEAAGAMDLGVHLRGHNPNFQDGRTVEFNVDLDAHLTDLVRAGLASYRVPEEIERRLRDFSERGAR